MRISQEMNYASSITNTFYLLIGSFVILLIRLLTYSEPLELDITTYAVIASELNNGKELYRDLWDHKPPGVYIVYQIFEYFFGHNYFVFILNIFFSCCSLVAIYFTSSLIGDKNKSKLSILFFSLLGGTIFCQANQPNCEVIMNPFLVGGFYYFYKGLHDYNKFKCFFISGLYYSLASVIKQLAVVPILVFLIYFLYEIIIHKKNIKEQILSSVLLFTPTVLIWLFLLSYFYLNGNFAYFYECVYLYNKLYSGSLLNNILNVKNFIYNLPINFIFIYTPLVILALLSVLQKNYDKALLLLLYGIGSILMVLLTGRYFAHYCMLLIPPIIILAIEGSLNLDKFLRSSNKLKNVVLSICLMPYFFIEFPILLFKSTSQISVIKYQPYHNFNDTVAYANFIKSKLPSNYRFYYWGAETGLYFYGRYSPISSVFYNYGFNSKLKKTLVERVSNDIVNEKPEILIEKSNYEMPKEIKDLFAEYRIVNDFSKYGFTFYLHKDLNLEL